MITDKQIQRIKYVRYLLLAYQQRLAERDARDTEPCPPPAPEQQKLDDWYDGLPEHARAKSTGWHPDNPGLIARIKMPERRDVPPHRYDWPCSTASLGPVTTGLPAREGRKKTEHVAWREWGDYPVFPGRA